MTENLFVTTYSIGELNYNIVANSSILLKALRKILNVTNTITQSPGILSEEENKKALPDFLKAYKHVVMSLSSKTIYFAIENNEVKKAFIKSKVEHGKPTYVDVTKLLA